MYRYKVVQKCFYGEEEQKPRLMERGEVYESETLKPKDAPAYFTFLKGPKLPSAAIDNRVGLDYAGMKAFVATNEIAVVDVRKETLVAAILDYKAKSLGAEKVAQGELEVPIDLEN